MMSMQLLVSMQRADFSLQLEQQVCLSGVTALFGASASGKSSLLNAIVGLEPFQGEILFKDQVWQQGKYRHPVWQRGIGYAMQDSLLFPHLSVAENIQFADSKSASNPLAADQCVFSYQELVDVLMLEPLLRKSITKLSGGEQQRVALARACLAARQLLILDEALSALDHAMKRKILAFLRRKHLQHQLPLLYVSHQIDEIAQIADDMVVLDKGKVIAHGAVNELLLQPDLPFAQSDEAEVILEGVVSCYDAKSGLTVINCSGQEFRMAGQYAVGDQCRLRILARDVSVCLEKPQDTSILNILPVNIGQISPLNGEQVLLSLQLQSGAGAKDGLLARISRYSCSNLQLRPDMALFAQIKSVALLSE